jgi:transglutaminase-like putative cysteine protease
VAARLEATVIEPATIVLAVAVSSVYDVQAERLVAELDGRAVPLNDVAAAFGTRLHTTGPLPPGRLTISYDAQVGAMQRPVDGDGGELARIELCRPSRYCESDRLAAVAASELGGLEGRELLDAAGAWVGSHVRYVSGSSRHTDGAVSTYLSREGVCRDFAHLVAALLRARDVPTRVVSVYAPGLDPMDFHAIAEAWLDGSWYVIDATGLAPRTAMVRICTGRDAADTAFMTAQGGSVVLDDVQVVAVAQPSLPTDPAGPAVLT